MRFLIDVDGVCADLISLLLRKVNERFNKHYVPGDITQFDFFGPVTPFTEGEKIFVKNVLGTKGFTYEMSPLPGAIWGVKEIQNQGHEVVFLTSHWSESESWCFDRYQWLREYYQIEIKDIVFAYRKELVKGDVFIDDRDRNCIRFTEEQPEAHVLLLDQPWNKHVDTDKYPMMERFDWRRNLTTFLKNMSSL